MTRVLVSVRDAAEARQAAAAGVPFIDLKEPARGALGGLDPAVIAPIVAQLRASAPQAVISATIGDWPAEALDAVAARCRAVAATGVDHVKVGVVPGPLSLPLLRQLDALRHAEGLPIVPVLVADDGVPWPLVDAALAAGFGLLMLGTVGKRGGSLFDRCALPELAGFVAASRAVRARPGLAGALRADDWPRVAALAPDFAGFRSAVCDGDRAGALSPHRLAALMALSLAAAQA
jgi:(5-formylfuran-3-yl)methyl phosphate synthase